MSATLKMRWQRLVNKIAYLHEESELLDSIIKESGADFNEYYGDFCKKLEIDIKALNDENEERIRKAYGVGDEASGVEEATKALTDLRQQLVTYIEPTVYSTEEEIEDTSEYQMTQDEKEIHESFNKLFRKIAMELHPDKLSKIKSEEERKEKVQKFNKVKQALDQKKYFVLLDVAKELNITTPRNYKQQIRWMKKEITKIEDSIEASKKTYNYLFSECDTEDEKDDLIVKFMKQLFGVNIQKQLDD